MIQSSKALYWMYALRLIDKTVVIQWADALIEKNIINDDLFFLSTCGNSDVNEVMAALKSINIRDDMKMADLIDGLIDYYSKAEEAEINNTALLLDFALIYDLDDECIRDLQWLEDEICLIRDGVISGRDNLKKYILDNLRNLKSAHGVS
jgi:hypothetical protein